MTIIPILLKFGPWLLAAAGVLFGMFRHQQARAVTAQAGQKAAEAQATAAAAREQVAQSANAEAQANADAAQAGAAAAKERSDAETNVGALPAGGAEQQLRDGWSRD
ncbi:MULTISPECIES: hypothetical protein [Burkholderia]|uniref:Uncharacterized protein n=1 Tax=Burkholderia vietnamiensis TaxID=60552 RepID=A0AA44Y1A6_BURVI|nr:MULTISPECIES: hypothetical protein [Burkholderia]ALJ98710.1 Rz-like inner membrane spanin component [Burkholderia phage PE067]AYJ74299.1 hypothetical protein phiE131_033 [Burkholderia phage phiE131]AYJ74369.1 hypothetical protein phiE058_033 [Burkholderia phage phiE058]KVS07750.1 hypothetical protein WK32_09435 [Burkholderia vietnamiensis]MCS6455919.1 hypothetical protein [Burkholderia thailandensis]